MSLPTFDTMSLQEGVRDAHALKVVFVTGSGGAGKGAVSAAMFAGFGLKTIDQDRHLERFLKDAKIPLSQAGSDYGIFKKAQKLKGRELRQYAQQRLGLLIDSTGWDYQRVATPVKKLRELGYDVYMVFVTTKLDTALARNKARAEKGGRGVPMSFVKTAHEGAHRNLSKYIKLFGKPNSWIVDNDQDVPARTWTSLVAPKLRKIGNKIVGRPIKNPKGRAWIEKQMTAPDINDPARAPEWPESPPSKPLKAPKLRTAATSGGDSGKKGTSGTRKGKKKALPAFTGGQKQGGATVTFGKKPGLLAKLGSIFKKEDVDTVSILHEAATFGTGYWYKGGRVVELSANATHTEPLRKTPGKFGLTKKVAKEEEAPALLDLAIDKGWVRLRVTPHEMGISASTKRGAKHALDWFINKHSMPKTVNIIVRYKPFVSLTTQEEITAYAWG